MREEEAYVLDFGFLDFLDLFSFGFGERGLFKALEISFTGFSTEPPPLDLEMLLSFFDMLWDLFNFLDFRRGFVKKDML